MNEIFIEFNKSISFVFFVGAFVSRKEPTNIPMANELKDAILNSILNANKKVRDRINEVIDIRSVSFKKRFEKVPLEQIMNDLIKLSNYFPAQLLSFIAQSKPNQNHFVLAYLLEKEFVKIITTNFDEFIEQCLTQKKPIDLYKPHGTISKNKTLVIKISDVGKQLINPYVKNKMKNYLQDSTVLFLGYSGRDIDLRPIIEGIRFRKIYWIIRPRRRGEKKSELKNELDYLNFLENKNYQTRFLSVDADLLLKNIGIKLGLLPQKRVNSKIESNWERCLDNTLKDISKMQQLSFLARVFRACDQWTIVKIISNKLLKQFPQTKTFQFLLWNSEANYFLGKYKIASVLARNVLSSSNNDSLIKAQSYNILGNIASRSTSANKRKWAPIYYKKVITNLNGNSDDELLTMANSFLSMGIYYKNIGKYKEANNEFKKGIKIAKKVGALFEISKMEEARGIVSRWQVREMLSQKGMDKSLSYYNKGVKYYEKASNLAYSLGAMTEYGRILSNYANLEMEYSDINFHLIKAKSYVERAILAEKSSSNNQHEIVKRIGQKAKILQIERRWKDALYQWKNIKNSLIDVSQIGVCYREMAQCYYMTGNIPLSKKYINRSLNVLSSGLEKNDSLFIKEHIYNNSLKQILNSKYLKLI